MSTDIKEISSGNKYVFSFNLVNTDNTPRDLTNTQSMTFAISKWSHTEVLVSKTDADPEITITDAANGNVEVLLTSTMLNSLPKGRLYYYELQQINTFNEPITLTSGYFNLKDRLIEE